MYQGKDRQTLPLFSELFPFGGKLAPEIRWLKIAIIPASKKVAKFVFSISITPLGFPPIRGVLSWPNMFASSLLAVVNEPRARDRSEGCGGPAKPP